MSDKVTNIRRYECCLCTRAPNEIEEPHGNDEGPEWGTPKIARVVVPVGATSKSFDICRDCGVNICSTFASGAKFFREQNEPDEPPPLRYA